MAAKCKHRLYNKAATIERLLGTDDAHGQIDVSANANWSSYLRTWCAVISKGGTEFWKVQQTNATVTHVWYATWSSVLASATPDMRLICEGNTYEIVSVIDIDLAHKEVEIQTRQAVQ